jgi:RNAse (barnase) inhibitor barstar
MIREFSGFIACLPNKYAYDESTIFVDDPCSNKKYTNSAEDFQSLCEVINSPTHDIKEFFQEQLDDLYDALATVLEVPVTTIYTNGESTESSYVYASLKRGINQDPVKVHTQPGDGLVTEHSLSVLFRMHQHHNVKKIIVKQSNHTSLVMHPKVIDVIKSSLHHSE